MRFAPLLHPAKFLLVKVIYHETFLICWANGKQTHLCSTTATERTLKTTLVENYLLSALFFCCMFTAKQKKNKQTKPSKVCSFEFQLVFIQAQSCFWGATSTCIDVPHKKYFNLKTFKHLADSCRQNWTTISTRSITIMEECQEG